MCYGDHRNNDPGNRHPETSREPPEAGQPGSIRFDRFLRHVTATHKKYTAVPIHGGTARIETKLQGKDNRASASSYCIGENHGAVLCSAHILSYTLHVCRVSPCRRDQQAALSNFVQLQQVGVITLVSNSKPQRAVGQLCFNKASLCTWSELTVSRSALLQLLP